MISGVTVTTSNEDAFEKSRLKSIVLNENLMKSSSVARLSSFLGISYNLKSISLRSCSLEDNSIKLICERLIAIKHLSKLDLTDNRLTDSSIIDSLTPLIEGGMCPPFSQLLLSQNNITSKGAQSLFTALLRSRSIIHVGLADTRLNEEFGIWLARHLKIARKEHDSYTISQIDLSGNGIV